MVAHAPCLVQGRGAAESIAKALAILDADADVEVIIVGRGGGSLEDLWAFNEETVVRAIAACRTPVVSAVGHETDTTLADLVADLRAKTPTMAGELVVPVEDELRQRIDELRWELDRAVDLLFQRLDQRLQALAQHRALAGPAHQLAVKSQRLDELSERLDDLISQAMTAAGAQCQALERSLHLARPALRLQGLEERLPGLEARLHQAISRRARLAEERFRHVCQRLDAYSPLGVIGRGYAVLHGPDERTVSRLEQAPAGTPLRARISDGWLELRAEGGRSERIQEASDFYRAADDDPNEESP
jgi:exodeoxyribonuclease VII large subunit